MTTAEESPVAQRREALRMMRDGSLMFVIAGGLFGLYCWWAIVVGDPPRGTWQWRALVLFGALIHLSLIVLLGAALAGLCVVYDGLRLWLRSWRRERPQVIKQTKAAAPASSIPMVCAKCGSERVDRLPPNGISPRPGYRCGNCGARMLAPGMRAVYFVTSLLGAGVAALFLPPLFGGGDDEAPFVDGLYFAGVGVVVAGYSLRQLARPRLRRGLCAKDRQEKLP